MKTIQRMRLSQNNPRQQAIDALPDLISALQEIAQRGPLEDYNSASALRLRLVGTQTIARTALAKATGNE